MIFQINVTCYFILQNIYSCDIYNKFNLYTRLHTRLYESLYTRLNKKNFLFYFFYNRIICTKNRSKICQFYFCEKCTTAHTHTHTCIYSIYFILLVAKTISVFFQCKINGQKSFSFFNFLCCIGAIRNNNIKINVWREFETWLRMWNCKSRTMETIGGAKSLAKSPGLNNRYPCCAKLLLLEWFCYIAFATPEQTGCAFLRTSNGVLSRFGSIQKFSRRAQSYSASETSWSKPALRLAFALIAPPGSPSPIDPASLSLRLFYLCNCVHYC